MFQSAVKKMIATLRKRPEIELAYLFGSAAKGSKTPRDVDIAVLLKKPPTAAQKIPYTVKMTGLLEKAAPHHNFDIVILNRAESLLCFQVIKYGKLLFERHRGTDSDFRVRVMTRYHDVKPLHDFFFQRAMER